MSDLTDFLLARIAEDEERARDFEHQAALAENGDYGSANRDRERWGWFGVKQLGITPARVLAECEARRRIVGLTEHGCGDDYLRVQKALALPYVDHPEFRPEWAV